jgi:hypothetical protein
MAERQNRGIRFGRAPNPELLHYQPGRDLQCRRHPLQVAQGRAPSHGVARRTTECIGKNYYGQSSVAAIAYTAMILRFYEYLLSLDRPHALASHLDVLKHSSIGFRLMAYAAEMLCLPRSWHERFN